jgi:hypothetical protein
MRPDGETLKNSRAVRWDFEKFQSRKVFSSYFVKKRYKVRILLHKSMYLDEIHKD